jgi:two-component system, OmpR family, KDP operon response regulator KdpE
MSAAVKILVVDDEPPIRKLLRMGLAAHGYEVLEASNGKIALELLAQKPDLVILDLGLPDIDGLDLLRRIRNAREGVPVLVLSSRGDEAGKVAALDLGADDYVTKPFSPEELLARIRVALRRGLSRPEAGTGRAAYGQISIDYDRRRVLRGGEEIRLTPKEFDLLSLLAQNCDRVLTHRVILTAIWGANAVDQPEHLWVLISQLRKKIEIDPANPQLLVSEPWVGYRLVSAWETGENHTRV